jgi:hypothetical protein
MNRRLQQHEDAQAAVLARMDAARVELLAVTRALRVLSSARASEKYRVTGIARTVLQTPNAALIAALLVSSIVIGPRRLVVTAIRAALTAWITRTVSTFASRKVRTETERQETMIGAEQVLTTAYTEPISC